MAVTQHAYVLLGQSQGLIHGIQEYIIVAETVVLVEFHLSLLRTYAFPSWYIILGCGVTSSVLHSIRWLRQKMLKVIL